MWLRTGERAFGLSSTRNFENVACPAGAQTFTPRRAGGRGARKVWAGAFRGSAGSRSGSWRRAGGAVTSCVKRRRPSWPRAEGSRAAELAPSPLRGARGRAPRRIPAGRGAPRRTGADRAIGRGNRHEGRGPGATSSWVVCTTTKWISGPARTRARRADTASSSVISAPFAPIGSGRLLLRGGGRGRGRGRGRRGRGRRGRRSVTGVRITRRRLGIQGDSLACRLRQRALDGFSVLVDEPRASPRSRPSAGSSRPWAPTW